MSGTGGEHAHVGDGYDGNEGSDHKKIITAQKIRAKALHLEEPITGPGAPAPGGSSGELFAGASSIINGPITVSNYLNVVPANFPDPASAWHTSDASVFTRTGPAQITVDGNYTLMIHGEIDFHVMLGATVLSERTVSVALTATVVTTGLPNAEYVGQSNVQSKGDADPYNAGTSLLDFTQIRTGPASTITFALAVYDHVDPAQDVTVSTIRTSVYLRVLGPGD